MSFKNLTFLDLFSGIGGFHYGLTQAGHKCVGFCEFDKYAVMSYTSMYLLTEEQRNFLSTLSLKQRQKEILKEEYRNGLWYANDIRYVTGRDGEGKIPRADIWCFGSPCQSFSLSGKREGLEGESGLIREVFRILWEIEEDSRPEWLIYENVKGMFSSNRGFDFLAILSEMDSLGYDLEWQLFNSKWYVPQNRERVYLIGHSRRYGRSKILPISPANEKDNICGQKTEESHIDLVAHREGYRRNLQVYSTKGITETLDTCAGGGRQFNVALPVEETCPTSFCDMSRKAEFTDTARCLVATYNNGVRNTQGMTSGVAIPLSVSKSGGEYSIWSADNGVKSKEQIATTISARDSKGFCQQEMTGIGIMFPEIKDNGEEP